MARFLSNTDRSLRRCWHPMACSAEAHGMVFELRRVLADLVSTVTRVDG